MKNSGTSGLRREGLSNCCCYKRKQERVLIGSNNKERNLKTQVLHNISYLDTSKFSKHYKNALHLLW